MKKPKMSVIEYAESFGFVPPHASARPGKFSVREHAVARGPMLSIPDDLVREITIFAPASMGKTTFLDSYAAYVEAPEL